MGSNISDAAINEQVKVHVDSRQGHIRKCSAFSKKNEDAPLKVKRGSAEECLKWSYFYNRESWLCDHMQFSNSVMINSQEQMLEVRMQTCTDLVQVELNTVSEIIGPRKTCRPVEKLFFLKKAMSHCRSSQSPLSKAAELAISAGSPQNVICRASYVARMDR